MANRGVSVGVKIDGTAKGYKSATEEAKRATEKLAQDLKNKSKGASGDVLGINKAFQSLAGTIGSVFAAQKVIAFGAEVYELSAKAEGVRNAFERLNQPALLNNLRKATRGTVSDLNLMTAAVQSNNFKISLEQLPRFFEFATRRASETGEGVDYLVDSIVRGIGRKSAMILDNLGISASELNEELRLTPDYATAVGTIIQREMAKAGEYTETAADAINRYKASLENFKTSWSQSGASKWITKELEYASDFLDVAGSDYFTFWEKLGPILKRDLSELTAILEKQKELNAVVGTGYNPAAGAAAKMGFNTGFNMFAGITPKGGSTPTGGGETKATDNVFGNGYWQRQVEAAAEWNDFADKISRRYDLIDTKGKSIAGVTLSQIESMNYLVQKTEEWSYNWDIISYQLESVLSGLFRAGVEGWEEFGRAASNTIKAITAELAAKAALWMLLNILTGGQATGGMKLGEYLLQGFGITKSVGAVPVASGGGVLRGRDIFLAGNRYGSTLIKNT